ncbi:MULTISPECIES: hypothetical protein [Paracoccus]|uniref:hypothetical protein n=1 Tax=Paracoccus TaxID=265 RepID=UPI001C8E8D9A|nr:hypothetical protein [Paracoccus yeei]MBY0138040.1 hypothetical protein [Paracoccus yeei]
MLTLLGATLGVWRGMIRARQLGGNRLDMIQYAIAHAIAFGLLGAFVGITLGRLFTP